jgi:hypothetical protein
MAKWLVWYTDESGRGDSVQVEADTKYEAADKALDQSDDEIIIDNVELVDK